MSYNPKTGLYEGYIYCIENTANGKQYIGQTRKIVRERFAEHLSNSDRITNRGYVLYEAIRKYGKEYFVVSILEAHACKTNEDLCKVLDERETSLISEMKTQTPYGYNVMPGGSKTIIANTQSVYCFSMNGELIKEFPSMAEAEREFNLPHGKISVICSDKKHDRVSCGGFLWSKTCTPPDGTKHLYRRPVVQMTMDGEIVARFESAKDAANKLKLHNALICKCCYGERKSTGGYRWAFCN